MDHGCLQHCSIHASIGVIWKCLLRANSIKRCFLFEQSSMVFMLLTKLELGIKKETKLEWLLFKFTSYKRYAARHPFSFTTCLSKNRLFHRLVQPAAKCLKSQVKSTRLCMRRVEESQGAFRSARKDADVSTFPLPWHHVESFLTHMHASMREEVRKSGFRISPFDNK